MYLHPLSVSYFIRTEHLAKILSLKFRRPISRACRWVFGAAISTEIYVCRLEEIFRARKKLAPNQFLNPVRALSRGISFVLL